jgi:hypothetical protein
VNNYLKKCAKDVDEHRQIVLESVTVTKTRAGLTPHNVVSSRMKKLALLLAGVATFAIYTTSYASITNAWWNDDGDGMMVCTNWTYEGSTLNMWGTQYGSPAHMQGWADASDAIDPTLTLGNSVNNDTGVTWLGYQVNVIMSIPFTFTTPGPSVDNPPTSDWFFAGGLPVTLQVSGPWAGYYEGTLYFNAGTPLAPGGELDYLYSINFAGSTHYSFTQEAFAYMTSIPEPGTFMLAGIGGLLLTLRLRRNRLN